MGKIKKLSIASIVIVTLAVAGYFLNLYAYGVWRYEMTITVETPEGLKTGSAIRQGSNFVIAKIFETPPHYKGEAVVVDLGERGVLFAQRLGPARRRAPSLTTVESIHEANKIPFDVKSVMEEKQYPRMVSFTDLKDTKTAVLVRGWQLDHDTNEYVFEDNVEKIFGKGVRIKEITFERTKRPLSKKIGPYLPDNYEYYQTKEGWDTLPKDHQQRIDQLVTLIRK